MAGHTSVTSTDQRQSNRLKGRRCWEGTDGPVQGQGGNERQNEGRIFEHHWEMRLELLCKRYQRIEQIPKGKTPCDYALKSTRKNEMNRKEKKRQDYRKEKPASIHLEDAQLANGPISKGCGRLNAGVGKLGRLGSKKTEILSTLHLWPVSSLGALLLR